VGSPIQVIAKPIEKDVVVAVLVSIPKDSKLMKAGVIPEVVIDHARTKPI
jgi:hypothetical protein